MAKVQVINGPNLNMLGQREVAVYGDSSLDEINAALADQAKAAGIELTTFQSNHEGEIVDLIQQSDADVIILNPGGYTHYSVAIRDAVASIKKPVIEVHLSNIYAREDFRKESVIAPVAAGQIAGFGVDSYYLALDAAIRRLRPETSL